MNIYVSNLGHRVTEESLAATFATHGTVYSTIMAMDTRTGYTRGFAFVVMPDATEGTAAIQRINDSIIDGRLIRVEEAIEPRDLPHVHPAAHPTGR